MHGIQSDPNQMIGNVKLAKRILEDTGEVGIQVHFLRDC